MYGHGRTIPVSAWDTLAGFVGALAQVSIHLSFTPVPVTGQTLGVLLAGTALGWRRAAAALGF